MKFTIEDSILGRRELDVNDEVALIRDQHKLLCTIRAKQGPTKALNQDIKVYEFILNHDCPEKAAAA